MVQRYRLVAVELGKVDLGRRVIVVEDIATTPKRNRIRVHEDWPVCSRGVLRRCPDPVEQVDAVAGRLALPAPT
jgi:hypothetical protein